MNKLKVVCYDKQKFKVKTIVGECVLDIVKLFSEHQDAYKVSPQTPRASQGVKLDKWVELTLRKKSKESKGSTPKKEEDVGSNEVSVVGSVHLIFEFEQIMQKPAKFASAPVKVYKRSKSSEKLHTEERTEESERHKRSSDVLMTIHEENVKSVRKISHSDSMEMRKEELTSSVEGHQTFDISSSSSPLSASGPLARSKMSKRPSKSQEGSPPPLKTREITPRTENKKKRIRESPLPSKPNVKNLARNVSETLFKIFFFCR